MKTRININPKHQSWYPYMVYDQHVVHIISNYSLTDDIYDGWRVVVS